MNRNILLENLSKPEELEELYWKSPQEFENLLTDALLENKESETLRVWKARLFYKKNEKHRPKVSVYLIILLCLLAGFTTKLPAFFNISSEWYYPRFLSLIIVSPLIVYFLIQLSNSFIKTSILGGIALSIFYLLILPSNSDSASITMALIHMPLLLLTLLAIVFMSNNWRSVGHRLDFIRYLGEMVTYSVLILVGGMVLTGLTFGLFNVIGLQIEQWYIEYIVVLGLVSAPLVSTYLYDSILSRESTFASVLSNVFSPLFFITIFIYLIATVIQGKNPYSDREFLIIFNGLLLAIWAITVFSISGKPKKSSPHIAEYINIALIGVTLMVDAIALSAIIFRWAEYGITLNRVVVTGANVLIFMHLSLLLWKYVKYIRGKDNVDSLKSVIAQYLPIYSAWSLIVVVLLPLLFGYQ